MVGRLRHLLRGRLAPLGGAITFLEDDLKAIVLADVREQATREFINFETLAFACARALWAGCTLEEIGKAAGGRTRERIRQLIERHVGPAK
jgi:hypothetical protein